MLNKKNIKFHTPYWGLHPKRRNKFVTKFLLTEYKNADIINLNTLYNQIKIFLNFITKSTVYRHAILLIGSIKNPISYTKYIYARKRWVPGMFSNYKNNKYLLTSRLKTLPKLNILITAYQQNQAIHEATKYQIPTLKTQNTNTKPELSMHHILINTKNENALNFLSNTLIKASILQQTTAILTIMMKKTPLNRLYKFQHI